MTTNTCMKVYELPLYSCTLFINENLFVISKKVNHSSLLSSLLGRSHDEVHHTAKLHDFNRVNIVLSFHPGQAVFKTFCCLWIGDLFLLWAIILLVATFIFTGMSGYDDQKLFVWHLFRSREHIAQFEPVFQVVSIKWIIISNFLDMLQHFNHWLGRMLLFRFWICLAVVLAYNWDLLLADAKFKS